MSVLPDVLQPGLKVVFCGTAVGNRSAAVGEYYAGRGNQFWRILHLTGLTPRLLEPREYMRLLEYGLGLEYWHSTASALRERFWGGDPGFGLQPETVGPTAIFVLPSTSGAARGSWDPGYWHELARYVR